jgi:transcriptional regulator NrdR family protein
MRCPRCEGRTEVLRKTNLRWLTRRRRRCRSCAFRFSTRETIDAVPLQPRLGAGIVVTRGPDPAP